MDYLYVYIYDINEKEISLSLESLIIIFVHKYCDSNSLQLNLIQVENLNSDPFFTIDKNQVDYKIIDKLPELANFCVLPIAIVNNITVISGLCSVARQIIKNTPVNSDFQKLLGFREACLMACNESSIWTKFCEIDMIQSVKDILTNPEKYFKSSEIIISNDLSKFECHMSQPVRMHNVYKVAQDQAKLKNENVSEINTKIAKENLNLSHIYGEGPYMTLADIILYPSMYIFTKIYPTNLFDNHLPLTSIWFENMTKQINFLNVNFLNLSKLNLNENITIKQENIQKTSLYVSDPKRYKPRNRIFTKQPDILNALNIVKELNLKIDLSLPLGHNLEFVWSKIPQEANPMGGALPETRMLRKSQQLENLAKAVIKIAKPKDVIVDFCSGSGHLGILLAVKLPDCTVVLLENKERSLIRAKERVLKLNLTNVIFLQCNLDYFKANFDIGVSLHACGVATDLVIQHCLKRKAAFVSCPCCYGGVHNCHHLTYPRSNVFRNSALTLRDYLVLGHSADQTHDAENVKTKQGIECMNIIDTDRKLQAEEFGYEVFLGKMIPETCTPKNNVLVGIYKGK